MTVFSNETFDATEQTCFFGKPVNIARYDKQRYNTFEKLTEKQLGFFWRPEEVDLSRDGKDFKALNDHEKHILRATSSVRSSLTLYRAELHLWLFFQYVRFLSWKPGSKLGRLARRFIPVPTLISFVTSILILPESLMRCWTSRK